MYYIFTIKYAIYTIYTHIYYTHVYFFCYLLLFISAYAVILYTASTKNPNYPMFRYIDMTHFLSY